MKPELKFETKRMMATEHGEESSLPDLLGENILQNQLQFDLDEEDEIYEGYGRRPNAYPYRQYNCYSGHFSEKEFRTAVLENDYLSAVFLPDLGGRLWELWDKKKNRNLLYTNDVLQFRNLAVRNAWFSGGVEWNIGVIGHTPLTADSLYVAQTRTDDGDPVLRMYEYERIRGVVYQMDFWLEEKSRFLNCRMRIVNESAEVIPMYWWSNIAVPEFEGGRIVVPADRAFTNGIGTVYRVDVPVVNGVDITDYGTIPNSVDYFFDIPAENPKYIANLDRTGCGLLHMSTSRLRSRKLFSWGHQDGSQHWQEFLTKDAGPYVEIQAGLGKTQYGCIPMAPHTAWEWMELYGAVEMSEEFVQADFQERQRGMTEHVCALEQYQRMERTLKETKAMAKSPAQLVSSGSGYGALAALGRNTAHLTFTCESETLRKWMNFFETGTLHCPDASEAPDEFLLREDNVGFLAESIAQKEQNQQNWYAYYQLGVGQVAAGRYEAAKESLRRSLSLCENAWAYHALACTGLLEMQELKHEAEDGLTETNTTEMCTTEIHRTEEPAAETYRTEAHAAEKYSEVSGWILRGMQMRMADVSYLKEGFRILSHCGKYQELCSFYETLSPQMQAVGKLRFLYVNALHQLGRDEQAYATLEENSGLEIEDIREGEDSVGQLWSELHECLFGEKTPVPYRYNFKAT